MREDSHSHNQERKHSTRFSLNSADRSHSSVRADDDEDDDRDRAAGDAGAIPAASAADSVGVASPTTPPEEVYLFAETRSSASSSLPNKNARHNLVKMVQPAI